MLDRGWNYHFEGYEYRRWVCNWRGMYHSREYPSALDCKTAKKCGNRRDLQKTVKQYGINVELHVSPI